jgi:carbamoyl-phosphate synthase large subunit
VNPRFGGAYLHAYGAGVDFFKLIKNNMEGKTNQSIMGNYEEDIVMMMYDGVVIVPKSEFPKNY